MDQWIKEGKKKLMYNKIVKSSVKKTCEKIYLLQHDELKYK